MMFTSEFLDELKDNPTHYWKDFYEVIHLELKKVEPEDKSWNQDAFLILIEAYFILSNIDSDFLFKSNGDPLFSNDSMDYDCSVIYGIIEEYNSYIADKTRELKVSEIKNKIDLHMSKGVFVYEFSQGDLEKVQSLINELRTEIGNSDLFEEKHKQRLLKRLEKLQSELHKKMSDLDGFWGLIGDAGVAIGKFGNDVKPIVDRIKEITEVVWQTQSRAEELPSGTPVPVLEDRSGLV